jgi:ribosomal 50S subunit-associated protein YjgA (DUF615 family)
MSPNHSRLRRRHSDEPWSSDAAADADPDDSEGAEVQSPAQDGEGAGDAEDRPSRSARKRAALALQKLGVRLTQLKSSHLQAMELPPELLEAVLEAQRLRSRAALARQHQYIGKLMRQIDASRLEQVQRSMDAKLRR